MSEEVTSGKVGSIAEQAANNAVWANLFGGGAFAALEAARAVAVATETQQLSVDPQLVDAMIKKLNEMKDALDEVIYRALDLGMDTKLGGGYAEAISQTNRSMGEPVQKTLKDVAKAIDELKTQIEKSRATYVNIDQASADSLRKLDGKS